ncbi:pyrroloquinoline quinone biosynthesis peptide chaperone PqqD [Acidocella sp.]|uniref:pyrroloquinoline quinone biosynthesis peptide chaperone PqqD n=1 Tax=Acidocella sp. TaxID=50710 RepID=UPI002620047E|nr:pyrroloquinoline quinone biosynthesis peptide chaperone PqqD [Acidocella sp.]
MIVNPACMPVLRRGVRRRFDATRGQNVLLCPERVIMLDDIADAITQLCDGRNSVAEISRILAVRFAADAAVVEADVLGFVQELVDKGLVAT